MKPLDPKDLFGTVTPPAPAAPFTQGSGQQGIQVFLTNIIGIIYSVAGVIFVFMIIFSAFQWMTSGGDKEAIGKARSRLTHSIIGIVLLALTFVILNVLGQILHFNFFQSSSGNPVLNGSGTPGGGVF